MKRGLKDHKSGRLHGKTTQVALITPMKRGLKDCNAYDIMEYVQSCTNYPDEKGTESESEVWVREIGICCTNYPDEKGTERGGSLDIPLGTRFGCTNYPDEKGTESS